MWSSKNGGKYHEEVLQQSPNYIEAKDWNLLLLKSYKLYPNILDVRNQLKTLSIREREEIFEICKQCAENEASEINEKLAAPANKENLEARSTQRHCKLKDSQRLAILNLHFMKNLSRTRISDKLGAPYTTVSRIIRNFNTFPSSTKAWFEYKEMEVSESPRIAQAIKKLYQEHKTHIQFCIGCKVRQTRAQYICLKTKYFKVFEKRIENVISKSRFKAHQRRLNGKSNAEKCILNRVFKSGWSLKCVRKHWRGIVFQLH